MLTHRWTFAETNGTVAHDSNGTIDAQLANLTHGTPGPYGDGGFIALKGTNDSYVDCGRGVGQFGTADFSVALWVNTTETLRLFDVVGNRTAPSHGNFFCLRMTGRHESGHNGRFSVEVDQDGNGTNYAAVNASIENLNDGKWHHVAAVRQQRTLLLYVDGQPVGQATAAGIANIANGNSFRIGRSLQDAETFAGRLQAADLCLFDNALSPAQVAQIAKPTTIAVLSGNNQSQQRINTPSGIPQANFAPLSVTVLSAGMPAAGQSVTWTSPSHPAAMAVQMEPSGASPCVTVTDAHGVATLNKMGGSGITAYYADGPFTVTASCNGASVNFTETVSGLAPPNVSVTIQAGNNQSVPRSGTGIPGGFAYFAPLQVRLTDVAGHPVTGAAVAFAAGSHPAAMAIQMQPSGAQSASTTTDGNGVATLNQMGGHSASCYYAEGAFSIVANAANAAPAAFSLTVAPTPPPPQPVAGATLAIQSGDGQTHPRVNTSSGIAMANFAALAVQLKGPNGAPLANQQVVWSSPSHPAAMAVQMEPSGASPCTTFTDANGVTVLNKMGGNSVTCYYADGAFTVAASYGSASATFHQTVGGQVPSGVTATILSGDGQRVARSGTAVPGGVATFGALQVKVVNAAGQPAAGVQVGFGPGTHPAAMAVQLEPAGSSTTTITTDANGVATLNHMGEHSVSCYYAAGPFTIVANPAGGNPVTFSLTVTA